MIIHQNNKNPTNNLINVTSPTLIILYSKDIIVLNDNHNNHSQDNIFRNIVSCIAISEKCLSVEVTLARKNEQKKQFYLVFRSLIRNFAALL